MELQSYQRLFSMPQIHSKTSITEINLRKSGMHITKLSRIKPWLTAVKVKYGQLQSWGANFEFKGVHSFQPMPLQMDMLSPHVIPTTSLSQVLFKHSAYTLLAMSELSFALSAEFLQWKESQESSRNVSVPTTSSGRKYWCSSAIRSSQATRMQQAVYQLPLRLLQEAWVQMLIVPVLVAPIKEVPYG